MTEEEVEALKAELAESKKQFSAVTTQLNAMNEAKKKEKEQALLEQENYKELSQTYKSEVQKLKDQQEEYQRKMLDTAKKQAVLNRLGGFKKPDFERFINLDNLLINEGKIDEVSLEKETNRLKTEYPELLKQDTPNLPADAPADNRDTEKKYSEMSEKEKRTLKKQLFI